MAASFLIIEAWVLPTRAAAQPAGWTEHLVVRLTTDGPEPSVGWRAKITLTPSNFDYAAAQSAGQDLRFSTDPNGATFDVPHFIESFNPGATSIVWVNVATMPASGVAHMFFGNPAAASTSSFANTFPNAFVSTGNSVVSAGGAFDWFQVNAGHKLTLTPQTSLVINARNVIVNGTIDGDGAGFAAPLATLGGASGNGPGAGGTSTPQPRGGAGGGGYGGIGGAGGEDPLLISTPGPGGPVYGSTTDHAIEQGSSGGATEVAAGGAGGGSISVNAQDVSVTGMISADGDSAPPFVTRGGGGGSGGGILIEAFEVAGGGILRAPGGDGSDGTSSTTSVGGGGGGGGRIKVFRESGPSAFLAFASRGHGGTGSSASLSGEEGENGTVFEGTADFGEITATVLPHLQPDALIGPPAGPFLGEGDYDIVSAGETRVVKVKRRKSARFGIEIQNDSTTATTFDVTGCSSSKGFGVSYFDGTDDVTTAATGVGHSVGPLAPGATDTLELRVKVGRRGPHAFSCRVSSASTSSLTDAVSAVVRVKR